MYRKLFQHPLVREYLMSESSSDLNHDSVGWGYKPSGRSAMKNANQESQQLVLFEDAFIRSMFPGYLQASPYGIIVDQSGIYYDSDGKSDLIKFLNGHSLKQAHWEKEISESEVIQVINRIRDSGVSKYNCYPPTTKHDLQKGILVVDQTKGDAAIQYAGMQASDFDRMLEDALNESDGAPVYIKTHPDHQYRKKHSCFKVSLLSHKQVHILPNNISTLDALSCCERVYVGTSLLGMEALIHSKKVITYGWSFYAGWGLTEDRSESPQPIREKPVSLHKLFEAAYMRYSHYYDPDTGKPCGILRIIDHIELQWKHWKLGSGKWITSSLSSWKKQLLPHYLGKQGSFVSHTPSELSEQSQILTWGVKPVPDNLKNYPVTRIEDGFIRSRGLGAEFNFPLSWVFDDVGIYFDARTPSKLKNILNEHVFSDKEISDAEELITFLRENKITKYNLGIHDVKLPKESGGKRTILIPGQVDSDASIKYGSPKLSNNRELLAEVRRQHPGAYICYKPHPDLLKGARKDAPLWDGIEDDVDYLIMEGDIISWIQAVDEVHTLTSTVGFEALIHKKPVHTYGLPFYAGWGLTHDWLKCERRTTTRTLLELACATLILYPTYLNPITKEFTTAINAAKILANPEFKYDSRSGLLKAVGKIKSLYYKLMRRF